MSHDFLDNSTNNQNEVVNDTTETMELKFVNDRLTNSENDVQTIVKEKCGSNRCENDISSNTAAHPNVCALHNEDAATVSKTIDDVTSIGYNLFLIPLSDAEQAEIDEALSYDPANIPRCYEALFDVAAALRKFGRVLGKDNDNDEDMSFYELLFVIWHGLYSEHII
jgi:hypothetical protein